MHEKQTETFDHLSGEPQTPTIEVSEAIPTGNKAEISPETLRIQTLNNVLRTTFTKPYPIIASLI